jgi:hypothetical protein
MQPLSVHCFPCFALQGNSNAEEGDTDMPIPALFRHRFPAACMLREQLTAREPYTVFHIR